MIENMDTEFKILLFVMFAACLIALLFCTYFIIRNELVYRFRTKVLDNFPLEVYKNLPEYDEMLYSFKLLNYRNYVKI